MKVKLEEVPEERDCYDCTEKKNGVGDGKEIEEAGSRKRKTVPFIDYFEREKAESSQRTSSQGQPRSFKAPRLYGNVDLDLNVDPNMELGFDLNRDPNMELDFDLNRVPNLDLNMEPSLDLNLDPNLDLNMELGFNMEPILVLDPSLDLNLDPTFDLNVDPNIEVNLVAVLWFILF
ncbi:unnamed protein product [Microthlaspi erraticum]|uniref:Uncharacterized protein n=1 Tax=Microthlaspi erraticum TaxID=1685480 RepID=A0A6D2JS23_9BRAS|nr:unnamed protein product [Microthlaspi erraticum]